MAGLSVQLIQVGTSAMTLSQSDRGLSAQFIQVGTRAMTMSQSDRWLKQARNIDGRTVSTVDTGRNQCNDYESV